MTASDKLISEIESYYRGWPVVGLNTLVKRVSSLGISDYYYVLNHLKTMWI